MTCLELCSKDNAIVAKSNTDMMGEHKKSEPLNTPGNDTSIKTLASMVNIKGEPHHNNSFSVLPAPQLKNNVPVEVLNFANNLSTEHEKTVAQTHPTNNTPTSSHPSTKKHNRQEGNNISNFHMKIEQHNTPTTSTKRQPNNDVHHKHSNNNIIPNTKVMTPKLKKTWKQHIHK